MNDRVAIDPKIQRGKPIIRGTRVPMARIVGGLAGGMSWAEIEAEYGVTAHDIRAALEFASELIEKGTYNDDLGAPMSSREKIDSIVRQVHEWPAEERVALADEILRDLARRPLAPPPRQTLQAARGLLRTGQPPPTDEQVERWIEEHRMHKYGQKR